MSLFLSRVCLNPLFAPALRLAADPYELHRKLLDTVPCGPKPKPANGIQPKTADLLFRVDATEAGPVVLVQTSVEPHWNALELAPRALRCHPKPRCTLRDAHPPNAWPFVSYASRWSENPGNSE
jgi:hypothetical protein